MSDDVMAAYLMGELPEEERSRLEQQYFVADSAFEQLLGVEDELIDDYVRGELPEHRRIQFERHFLSSSERRQRVAFARSLSSVVSSAVPPAALEPSVPRVSRRGVASSFGFAPPRWALAAAAAVLALGVFWLVGENARLRNELRAGAADHGTMRGPIEEARKRPDVTEAPAPQILARGERQAAPSLERVLPSVSLTLTRDLVRSGGDERKLVIPPGRHIVQFQVALEPGSYRGIRAAIETVDGSTVWTEETSSLRPMSKPAPLTLAVSSDLLPTDDYVLKISGVRADGAVEEIDAFGFRLTRQ